MGNNSIITDFKKTNNKNRGFTIVELLVVILVLGILAGIAVVGYGAWQKNTAVSQLKSELNGVAGAMEDVRNFGSGYPAAIPVTYKNSKDVTLTYVSGNSKTYCIQATTSQDSTALYRYDLSEKKEPQSGPCAAVQTVVNLARNPNPTSSAYWKSGTTSDLTASFVVSGGYNAVRSTRATTSQAILYGERNGTGVTTATTGDIHSIMFTVVSNVSTTLEFRVGYGNASSSTEVAGTSNQTISLVANVPQTIRKTFTLASGFSGQPLYFKIIWNSGVGAATNYFDVYRVMWVKGNYAGAYGDGYNAGAGWSWSGAANASTSSGPAL